jgi:excisionase family DNA binding protein
VAGDVTEVVAVPLVDGRWIALERAEFTAALRRAQELGLTLATQPFVATPTEQPLVTSREMAALLGVHDTTVEGYARTGKIPSVRLGKVLRFRPADVVAALREAGRARS